MLDSPLARFVVTVVVGLAIALTLAAVLVPPDPFSQLRMAGILAIVVLSLAYVLSYTGGYELLSRQLSR